MRPAWMMGHNVCRSGLAGGTVGADLGAGWSRSRVPRVRPAHQFRMPPCDTGPATAASVPFPLRRVRGRAARDDVVEYHRDVRARAHWNLHRLLGREVAHAPSNVADNSTPPRNFPEPLQREHLEPAESVSIGLGQVVNRCRPPIAWTTSSPAGDADGRCSPE